MKLSQFAHVSELMRTKWRVEGDLALLDDADAQNLRMTGIELFWSGFPEKRIDLLFHAEGGARLWASDDIQCGVAQANPRLLAKGSRSLSPRADPARR